MDDWLKLNAIIFILIMVIFGPIVIIWAITTLTGLVIPYTFKTWLAAFLLMILFNAGN